MTSSTRGRKISRSTSRLCAMQILFLQEQAGGSLSELLADFIKNFAGQEVDDEIYSMPDITFLSEIVNGTHADLAAIDEMISANLAESWEISRIDSVLRAILRAGVYEILHQPGIPTPVIVNEYVELTKAFADAKEASFVNGMLDAIAKRVRS